MRSLLTTDEMSETLSLHAQACCECNVCTLWACPEQLNPRDVCVAIERDLKAQNLWQSAEQLQAQTRPVHSMREYRGVPTAGSVANSCLFSFTVSKTPIFTVFRIIELSPNSLFATEPVRAAKACQLRGAHKIYAVATHGLFVDGADQLLSNPHLEKVVVTNSLPPFRVDSDAHAEKLAIIDIAEMLAKVIARMHSGDSLIEFSGGE